jgi:S1-C subfamily serine protease
VPVGGSDGALSTPSYVAVAEGTRGGATLRPLFLGRTDPFMESRWDKPLLALGGSASAEPGSFVFHLDGHLTGMVMGTEGGLALVSAQALLEAGSQLLQGSIGDVGDIGIEAQALSPALAAAAKAQYGSMVTYVDPAGPANGLLQIGDVIDAIDGEALYSVDSLSIRIARTRPEAALRVRVTRFGQQLEIPIVARARPSSEDTMPAALGLTLRAIAGIGAEVVRVEPQSAAARAGLLPGDIITQLVDRRAPLPRDITQAFANAAARSTLLLAVDRQGKHHVTALEKSS